MDDRRVLIGFTNFLVHPCSRKVTEDLLIGGRFAYSKINLKGSPYSLCLRHEL